MCVIAFAWDVHPRWRLLLIGNRDELHARPTRPLDRWPDAPAIVAGRDQQAGGTWMGASDAGRVAVVTNVRAPGVALDGASRGLLVADFLRGVESAGRHAGALVGAAAGHRPFNLLLFDHADAAFVSNQPAVRMQPIRAGVHGLSNGDLDAPWPKVQRVTAALHDWLAAGEDDFAPLFTALVDENVPPDAALPDTGVGLELERRLAPVFVRGERYGTRATTLIALDRSGGGCIVEHRFGPHGAPMGRGAQRFGGGLYA